MHPQTLGNMHRFFFIVLFLLSFHSLGAKNLIVLHHLDPADLDKLSFAIHRMRKLHPEAIFAVCSTEDLQFDGVDTLIVANDRPLKQVLFEAVFQKYSQLDGWIIFLKVGWEFSSHPEEFLQRIIRLGGDLYLSPNSGIPYVIICKNKETLKRLEKLSSRVEISAENLLTFDFKALPLPLRPFAQIENVAELDLCDTIKEKKHLSYLHVEQLKSCVWLESDLKQVDWREKQPYFNKNPNSPLLLFLPSRMMLTLHPH